MVSAQCPGTTKDGQPCSAVVPAGGTHCHWHDPQRAEVRADSRRRGGLNRATKARARRMLRDFRGMSDVQARLLLAFEQVHDGEMEPAIGTALATMARALVVVQGVAQFEQRLDELQRRIADMQTERQDA